MPKRTDLKSILIIGAGPIIIGQACEFDYSGTQACKALRAEGLEIVLVNSNPATIMTDPELADRTYVEPLTVETLAAIIERERPDALLPTVGGQTGLNLAVELCDIRNALRLQRVFEMWRPQIVFHAAAHKHVPFLERNPEEAIENNIFGSLNVLRAALGSQARAFVNISTDKAVNPTNVLGVSKRIAESLVLQAADEAPPGCRYVSVRFGNVLGSRGSVIPLFREQIRRGGPITVTHPDMTRYFMTIPEASQLVLQAGVLGQTGKVFVLNMGSPVRIVDMAMDMARLSGLVPGTDIDIRFTGVRPGEKLFEELFTEGEQGGSDVHAKVFEAMQVPKEARVLEETLQRLREAITLPEGQRQREILRCFKRLVPTYQPSPIGLGKYAEPEKAPALSLEKEATLVN